MLFKELGKTFDTGVTLTHPIVAGIVDVFGRIGCLFDTDTAVIIEEELNTTGPEVHSFVRVKPVDVTKHGKVTCDSILTLSFFPV